MENQHQNQALLSDELEALYRVVSDHGIPASVIKTRNLRQTWVYGYDSKYDIVVISKTGEIGEVVEIAGLRIALPLAPKKVHERNFRKDEQFWERLPVPPEILKVKSIHQWNQMPSVFRERWTPYIDTEFERRDRGFWLKINGKKVWIPPSHYMYLQWVKMDVGAPEYRDANRILFLFWEACKADSRCFGMAYVKIRRSGFSYMEASELVNIGTLAKDSHLGILSKTGGDAKKLFTGKVVPILNAYPFFFRPIQSGMDKPKTAIEFSIPASKITKSNMLNFDEEVIEGLNTVISWLNTGDNSYDGEKLLLLAHDESGKWLKPDNILNNWRVTKTCLRLGKRIVGKCMMGSTVNAHKKGGAEYKKLIEGSNVKVRNKNGQTQTGLYSLFIPMEYNMEGFIDKFGMPVFRTPNRPIEGVDGQMIETGAVDFWEAEIESLKSDPDALNEHYRQFPRTLAHAFRDESKESLFNLTKIYQQIDHNDLSGMVNSVVTGRFYWINGVSGTKVGWSPDPSGRFRVSWLPPEKMRNNWIKKNGVWYPGNDHLGAFGCDSYDISGVVDGGGSKGALHGLTKFHMDDAPTNEFFLEYVARPPTAEIFYEEVMMALLFYGMPVLAENNKPRLLYHIKNAGFRGFSMNRPDKRYSQLSKAEKEIGGIPNTSEDVKQAHAAAIESYIERHVGVSDTDDYRESGLMGIMPFNNTLTNWAKFEINNRTPYDASISSGLAIMACQRHLYTPKKEVSKINLNFATYDNKGSRSKLITS